MHHQAAAEGMADQHQRAITRLLPRRIRQPAPVAGQARLQTAGPRLVAKPR